MARFVTLVLVLAMVGGACGDDDGLITTSTTPPATTAPPSPPTSGPPSTPAPTASSSTTAAPATTTSTTVAPSTTTAPPTTAAPPTTTTTSATSTTPAPAPLLYVVDPSSFFPDPFPGSEGAHGSGCVADPGTLPNGVWFGFAESAAGGVITFDLACFFTGAAAQAAAAADGAEAFDFYIRNQNPATYAVPVDPEGQAWYIDASSGDVTAPTPIPMSAWPHPDSFLSCPGDSCSVWLYVNGGQGTEIQEQYLP